MAGCGWRDHGNRRMCHRPGRPRGAEGALLGQAPGIGALCRFPRFFVLARGHGGGVFQRRVCARRILQSGRSRHVPRRRGGLGRGRTASGFRIEPAPPRRSRAARGRACGQARWAMAGNRDRSRRHRSRLRRSNRPHRVSPADSITSFDDPNLKHCKIGVQLIGNDGVNTPPAHELADRGIIANVRGYVVYGDYKQAAPLKDIIEGLTKGDIDVAIVWGRRRGSRASSKRLCARPLLRTAAAIFR